VSAFRAKVEPASQGGHYVVVPARVAKAAGLRHGARVRGTVNGVPYRSALMTYGGVFHLGVHKATLAQAGAGPPARLVVTIELDDLPLPTDTVPDDLMRAMRRQPGALAAWQTLRPSLRREHVKSVLEAKKPETRLRRIERIVATLSR
jgi:Bacteriocin-protection, YdeI or OmpD-Associated/Domain of unknown function (DUF1905)